MHVVHATTFFLTVALLTGCAATMTALEHKDLRVQTHLSDTIFLDIENVKARSVHLDIRNTSGQTIDIVGPIVRALQQRGYAVTADPRSAFYLLQGNIRYVGQADPSALRQTLHAGYGGPVLGAAIGALAGRDAFGAGVGTLSGAALELVASTLVKDVTFTVVTDLQIAERTASTVRQSVRSQLRQGTHSEVEEHSESTRDRRRYQTRVVATANQVNLTFDEARGHLTEALAKSIAGIF
ncbi:MAG: complement resistance protein TraT [Gammaproteobacteria bacterium]